MGEPHRQIPTPEQAIEAACRLIDDGRDVFALGWSIRADQPTVSIGKEQIARIHALSGEREISLRQKMRRALLAAAGPRACR